MSRWRTGFGLWVLGLVLVTVGVSAGPVVINEVGWGGTAASSTDEWIELYNASGESVDLAGWVLMMGETRIPLDGAGEGAIEVRRTSVPSHGYYLLERTDDETVSNVIADLLFKGSLSNAGADLRLVDPSGAVVDEVLCAETGWPAGSGSGGARPYASMERTDPSAGVAVWATNNERAATGLDAKGTPIAGTPGAENSATVGFRTVPRVVLIGAPSGTVSGSVLIRWSATDPDGDPLALQVSLFVCDAAGENRRVVAETLTNQGSYLWNSASFAGAEEVYLQVVATDPAGLVGLGVAGPFVIAAAP
ncbi:MAG: lamin tail domain-containing protein [Candidatus Bipolaricaulis sp.]|nr:lamin tail domain-containing protein [Candidatus Bipolaricaulis sp.]MDD5645838.1 lamin tail domain-containing protein [Candidatus Bipolaricaulis sp.]